MPRFPMLARFKRAISTATVVLLLGVFAAVASIWLSGPMTRNLVPIAFVVVVVLMALRYGALAGIMGSLVGAAIFARWLYAPLGSLRIQDAAARDHIGWVVLAGITLSYLLAGPAVTEKRQPK